MINTAPTSQLKQLLAAAARVGNKVAHAAATEGAGTLMRRGGFGLFRVCLVRFHVGAQNGIYV